MELLTGNYDLIFFAIIIASAIFALIRGGINEILALSSWFIALWLMHRYGEFVNHFIPSKVSSPLLRSTIIYVSIFIAVAVVIAILKKIFARIISALGLGGLNYLLGLVFGIIRGIFICAVVIIIIEMLNLDSLHSWNKSKAYILINPALSLIINAIPNSLKNLPQTNHHFLESYI
jgi:membrane protein required for colicin V production